MIRVLAVCFILTLLLMTAPQADEGRIPVYGVTTIIQSGSYVVTRDISVGSGSAIALTNSASNVTLDLGGHTIQSSSTTVPVIDASSVPRLVIRNGHVQGGGNGIQANGSIHLTIEEVEVQGSAAYGIYASPVNTAQIAGCHIHDVHFDGVYMANFTGLASPTFDARVVDNLIERTGGSAIFTEGLRSGEVARNRISDWCSLTACQGIAVQTGGVEVNSGGTLIAQNTLSSILSTSGSGIFVTTQRNLVVDNVVRGAGGAGILVNSDENRIERNLTSGNRGHGIQINNSSFGSRNHVEANQAEGNTGAGSCGISFANGNGHTFKNNIVRGNPTGICGGTFGTNTDLGGNVP